MSSKQILRVNDKTDSYYIDVPGLFKINFKIAIIGKSEISGKTTIILNFLLRDKFYKKYFHGDDIFVVSNNHLDNKLKILAKEKDIPKANIMPFDEGRLEVLYEMLEDDFLLAVEDKKTPTPKLIIFDDVAYSGSLKNKTAGMVSKIVMNGRHAMISSIFTTQKYSLLSTAVRTNLTGLVCFGTNNKELELISEDFNYLKTKQDFREMFYEATKERNSFLAINMNKSVEDGRYMDTEFKPIIIKDPSSS